MEILRMEAEHRRAPWRQEEGIFTAAEVGRCGSSRNPARQFAGCFTAKEAATKALGARVGDLAMFREVEVGREGRHGSTVAWHQRLEKEAAQKGVRRTHVSVAPGRNQAGAVIILES